MYFPIWKRLSPFVFFSFSTLSFLGWINASETRLLETSGPVWLRLAETENDEWIEVSTDTSLEQGDTVLTGSSGTAVLSIDGESTIELGSDSEFRIETVQPEGFNFFLSVGELLAKVKSLLETKQTLNIRTPVAVAAVRGTEFAVSYNKETDTGAFGVFDEGEIHVTSSKEVAGNTILLTAGSETEVRQGNPPLPLRQLEIFRLRTERMKILRERRAELLSRWKNRSVEERQAFREHLKMQKHIRREQLRERLVPVPQKKGLSKPPKPSDRPPLKREKWNDRRPLRRENSPRPPR